MNIADINVQSQIVAVGNVPATIAISAKNTMMRK